MSRSKEEAIAAGVKTRETQHSMKRRKPWHNYYRRGTYMLTLVVEGRHPVLGRLHTPAASAAGSYIELTALGRLIRDEEIPKISAHYKMVEVWKLCIMPDHIHMIVRITEDLPKGKHLGHIIAGFKGGCSRAWWRTTAPSANAQGVVAAAATTATPTTTTATTTAATTTATTTAATTATTTATTPATTTAATTATTTTTTATTATTTAPPPAASAAGGPSLFERGYNDLILLEDGELDNWKHYLDDNPRRLSIKRLVPDYFTTLNYRDIAEWHCQLVGNSFLLDIPHKVAVIVHGGYTDQEFAAYREQWLACGEAGGVLVSAAIAKREKAVMREAMNRGYRLILVRENGFPSLYKPAGESFDACSEGRLLQVCPWEYHMERRTISREQCLELNRLVEYISHGCRSADSG